MTQVKKMTTEDMRRLNTSPEELFRMCPTEIDRELVVLTAPRTIFTRKILEALSGAKSIQELVEPLNPLNQTIFLHFYMEAYKIKYGESQN